MAEITVFDYFLLPIYLWIIYKIAYYYRNKKYPKGNIYRPYFIPGLTVKIAGAIFIGLIYNYYYDGGDTFNFFFHSQLINSTFSQSPGTWLRLITHHADGSNLIDAHALSDMYWYDDIPAYTTSCIGALIGMFCFTKYLVINVLVASISFIGMWLMFITFAQQYNKLIKQIAIAVLFIPGPVIWGSGLFKDSFCMFSVGCLVYCIYILFEKRIFIKSLILLSLLSIIILWLIKGYILIVLLPLLILKTILVYKKKAINLKRKVAFYFALLIFSFFAFTALKRSLVYLSAFSVDNVLETVKIQKSYLLQVSLDMDGSVYDLGDFEATLGGVAGKILPAINVTLFRPYLWESRSIIQLFSSLESTAILLLSLYLVFKRNIFKTIKNIYYDPNLIMCLIFTLIFAFFVGISSYNFGTLSRYKIPCTPFYMLFLMILLFKGKDEDKVIEPTTSENISSMLA